MSNQMQPLFQSLSQSLSDDDLVGRFQNGERAAFGELIRRHQKGLYLFLFRMTRDVPVTEDVVQDTFLRAFRKIHTFEGRSSFKSWLFRIGINTARNRFRGSGRIEWIGEESEADRERANPMEGWEQRRSPLPDHHLEEAQLREGMAKQIETLPMKQRMALTMRIYDDLPFAEIAEIMECPYDTAKANYRHALMNLRKRLSPEVAFGTCVQEVSG